MAKTLQQYLEFIQFDKLKGGLGDHDDIKKIDEFWLEVGAEVEKEHTKDHKTAQEIASDHLHEDKFYYKKLLEFVEHDKIKQILKKRLDLAKKIKLIFNPPGHHED